MRPAETYNDQIVRLFLLAAAVWGIVGMSIGVYAAANMNADLLKQITNAPLIRCDQVQWSLFGISMAGWNAILSLGGAAVILALTRKGMKG